MKKTLLFLLIVLTINLFSVTQSNAQSLDIYGGYTSVSCTGGGDWVVVKLGNRMIQCDPLGHAWFEKSVDTVASNNTDDQFGMSAGAYAAIKYPSTPTWGNITAGQILSWGLNTVGNYSLDTVFATATDASYPIDGNGVHSIPNKVPFSVNNRTCVYDEVVGSRSWGPTNAVKNVFYGMSPVYAAVTGLPTASGTCDYDDPNYYVAFAASLTANTDLPYPTISASDYKLYMQGIVGEESDQTFGYNGGYDFATTPANKNQPHISMLVVTGSPVQTGNAAVSTGGGTGAVYPKYQLYQKVTWMNQLISEYTTIAALNTSWGTSGFYTTFGTSGECFGVSSNFSFMACGGGNGSAVTTTGSGAGPYTATLSGTVSQHSVAVWVGTTLVCGDTGAGAWASHSAQTTKCSSGSVNYSTGAVTITFNTTPASAPTVEYIQNGWCVAGATGVMDECDNFTATQGWWGVCASLTFPATSCNFATYGGMNANLVTDLETFEYTITANWLSQEKTIVASAFPWVEFLAGPNGTWGVTPSCAVLKAIGQYSAVVTLQDPGVTQAMIDKVRTCAAKDVAITDILFTTAQPDSEMGYQAVTATHSGTTVTITSPVFTNWYRVGTPRVDVENCADPTYDTSAYVILGNITSASLTGTYTLGTAPTNSSTTGCIAYFDLPALGSPGTLSATQAARGSTFISSANEFINTTFTADGVKPFVGYEFWQFYDDYAFIASYGLETQKGNVYDGTEDVSSVVTCVAPANAYNCGGELQNYGNFISSMITGNATIDAAMQSNPGSTITTGVKLSGGAKISN